MRLFDGMIRAELHCHTVASSDGMITPDGLLKAASLQKLDVIAITDHDTTEGAFEFQRWFRRKHSPTQILIGEERTLENRCHLIGLFLKEDIKAVTTSEVIAEIHDQGGVVLVPHPCRAKDGLLGNRGVTLESLHLADAFELHNAKGSYDDNQHAAEVIHQHHLPCFGGSDAHYEADVGQCVNEIEAVGDPEASIRAMLKRETNFRIMARQQPKSSTERRYAPGYYALKPYLSVPRFLLPTAKQMYRFYWNQKHGGKAHDLTEIYRHA